MLLSRYQLLFPSLRFLWSNHFMIILIRHHDLFTPDSNILREPYPETRTPSPTFCVWFAGENSLSSSNLAIVPHIQLAPPTVVRGPPKEPACLPRSPRQQLSCRPHVHNWSVGLPVGVSVLPSWCQSPTSSSPFRALNND